MKGMLERKGFVTSDSTPEATRLVRDSSAAQAQRAPPLTRSW
jgi:hypothetical protein